MNKKLRGNAGMAGTGFFHLRKLRKILRGTKFCFCWLAGTGTFYHRIEPNFSNGLTNCLVLGQKTLAFFFLNFRILSVKQH